MSGMIMLCACVSLVKTYVTGIDAALTCKRKCPGNKLSAKYLNELLYFGINCMKQNHYMVRASLFHPLPVRYIKYKFLLNLLLILLPQLVLQQMCLHLMPLLCFCLFMYRPTTSVMFDYYCRDSELSYIGGIGFQSTPPLEGAGVFNVPEGDSPQNTEPPFTA